MLFFEILTLAGIFTVGTWVRHTLSHTKYLCTSCFHLMLPESEVLSNKGVYLGAELMKRDAFCD